MWLEWFWDNWHSSLLHPYGLWNNVAVRMLNFCVALPGPQKQQKSLRDFVRWFATWSSWENPAHFHLWLSKACCMNQIPSKCSLLSSVKSRREAGTSPHTQIKLCWWKQVKGKDNLTNWDNFYSIFLIETLQMEQNYKENFPSSLEK